PSIGVWRVVPFDLPAVETPYFPDQQGEDFGDVDQPLQSDCRGVLGHFRAAYPDLGHGTAAAKQFGENLALEAEAAAVDAELAQQIDAMDRKAVIVFDLLTEQEVEQMGIG